MSLEDAVAGQFEKGIELEAYLAKYPEDYGHYVSLVNLILIDAYKQHATQIYFQTDNHPANKKDPYSFAVVYLIDGLWYNTLTPPYRLKERLVERLKFLAHLVVPVWWQRLLGRRGKCFRPKFVATPLDTPNRGRFTIFFGPEHKDPRHYRLEFLPTQFGADIQDLKIFIEQPETPTATPLA
jgi:hypothetical protein